MKATMRYVVSCDGSFTSRDISTAPAAVQRQDLTPPFARNALLCGCSTFVHPSADGHLGRFHFVAVTSNAAVHLRARVSGQTLVFASRG